MKTEKIESITRSNYKGNVYNVELKSTREEDDLFWICNNIFVHNCFPKDLRALKYVANQLGVETKVLDGVWDKNNEVRPKQDRDWEQMAGRAVSKRD